MNTLVNRILDLAAEMPDKMAVAYKTQQLTYRQLARRVVALSDIFKNVGVREGDRVCFSAVSKPEMVICYLAVHMSGAVAVFLDKNATPQNMAVIFDESDAVLLLTDKPMKDFASGRRVESLRRICENAAEYDSDSAGIWSKEYMDAHRIMPKEDTLADLLFTTGTTGHPKGVMLSYRAVYYILKNTIDGIGMQAEDVLLLPLPLNHSFALRVLRAALYNGESVVLQNGFTFAKEVETNICTYHCNALAAVPASFEVMRSQMRENFQAILKDMRYLEFGAGSLTPGQRKELTELLPDTEIYNVWGSSETGGALFCHVNEAIQDEKKIGVLGRPAAGVEVMVLDEEGYPTRSDSAHPGRMALRGSMLMSGYWNQPALTAKTLRDGWLLTSDLIYRDEDGDIFMLGRADDIINVGGEKVSPTEVENIASEYTYIKECVCIGVKDPDGILGQIPVLLAEVRSGYDKDSCIRFLSSRMERSKLPHEIMVIDAVPKNRMQKTDRKAAVKLWENRGSVDLINPVIQTILARRSVRRFMDQPVPRAVLELLVKAGRQAPCGHNLQTWHFTVIESRERIEKLREAARESAKENKVNFYGWENPGALILISNDARNPDGCQDASCAAENILLAASSLGLGAVWLNPLMTLRNKEPVKSILDEFQIPANHIVWSTIALGYPAAEGMVLARKEEVVTWL